MSLIQKGEQGEQGEQGSSLLNLSRQKKSGVRRGNFRPREDFLFFHKEIKILVLSSLIPHPFFV
ncbi:MAG TPA: hypothetical protein DCE56_21205, partial [Cyanobacteria bacterium UBA8553]|nr:hypothetical protein [Cyanobacteria bacterium UBA8553]